MYVFVTVTELDAESREQDLGELDEAMSLEQVKDLVYTRAAKDMPPETRVDPRHFWHNDQLYPNHALLSDLASDNDIVALELRPDRFRVSIPGEPETLFAINPEKTTSDIIQLLRHHRHGRECCFELWGGGRLLNPVLNLLAQGVVPQSELASGHRPAYYVLWGAGKRPAPGPAVSAPGLISRADLFLRHRMAYYLWSVILLVFAALFGVFLGCLSKSLW